MKITLFTSNKNRHNYLINLLSKISNELFVVQECKTNYTTSFNNEELFSPLLKRYQKNVEDAELKFFGNSKKNKYENNIKILKIPFGDLNKLPIEFLSEYLQSEVFIVFGCSYIKGELVNYLVKKSAINIHMGVSPFYRGTACNFWALYDNNPHLVGATIHLLSKGLDSGPILYHAMSEVKNNPFEYTMSTVKSAFYSIIEKIKDGSLFKIKSISQDKSKEIRYSKKNEFNDEIIQNYFNKNINLNSKKLDHIMLKDPFFLVK